MRYSWKLHGVLEIDEEWAWLELRAEGVKNGRRDMEIRLETKCEWPVQPVWTSSHRADEGDT